MIIGTLTGLPTLTDLHKSEPSRRKHQPPSKGAGGSEYPGAVTSCTCDEDQAFLRQATRPAYNNGTSSVVRIADLFSGCGGLSLGMAEAARALGHSVEITLAADTDPTALAVLKENLPVRDARDAAVEELFARSVGARPSATERELISSVGSLTALLGGPPCQGHSNLNNHTRRADPRNALYSRMARAAELLRPSVVVIENVPAIVHDENDVVGETVAGLAASEYQVAERIIDLTSVGVPQRRRRHVLLAIRSATDIPPKQLLEALGRRPCDRHPTRSVRWAIEDLEAVESGGLHTASRVSAENAARIAWLHRYNKYNLPNKRRPPCHQDDHSYLSMYGRLNWDEPAQTITTGFGSMGQGRFVHPSKRRTLTPREAARLQTFPDFFSFGATAQRSAWARMIGNAVPPFLGRDVGVLALPMTLKRRGATRS
jgi:DNA (cytosine-5)-methyltransferase 1